jgi:hypothetical protein
MGLRAAGWRATGFRDTDRPLGSSHLEAMNLDARIFRSFSSGAATAAGVARMR